MKIKYEEFKNGELAMLDKDYINPVEVTIVCQSPNRMFTRVKFKNDSWDVMTNRLTKKKDDRYV